MKLEVFDDADSVARQAAAAIAADARFAIGARGRYAFAVSGGRTPWIMLRALANEDLPWAGVHIFQVDERVAPEGHTDRNLTHLRESFLQYVSMRPEQVHAMPVESARSRVGGGPLCARPPGGRWIAAGAGSGPPRSRPGRPHRLAGAGRSRAQHHGRRRRSHWRLPGPPPDDVDVSSAEPRPARTLGCNRQREGQNAWSSCCRRSVHSRRPGSTGASACDRRSRGRECIDR